MTAIATGGDTSKAAADAQAAAITAQQQVAGALAAATNAQDAAQAAQTSAGTAADSSAAALAAVGSKQDAAALDADVTAKLATPGSALRTQADVLYASGNRRLKVVEDLLDLAPEDLWSAHRFVGGNLDGTLPIGPEASMTGLRLALAFGAPIVDTDYHVTQDDVMIAMHDDTVDRTTNGTGTVSAIPYLALPQIDMGYIVGQSYVPEPVPTIEQIVSEVAGRAILTLEAKNGTADVPILADLLSWYGLKDSAFINTPDPSVAAAIVAAGCKAHVYGCSSVAAVHAADAAGAWLIEVWSLDPDVIAAAQAATNIKRFIYMPTGHRTVRDQALAAGCQGYVSDGVGYLDKTPITDLSPFLVQQRIPPGMFCMAGAISKAAPMFTGNKIGLSYTGTTSRRLRMPFWTPASDYSIYATIEFGGFTGNTAARTDIRVCVPSEQGKGDDTTSQGYVIGLRKTGKLQVWSANATLGGAATEIVTVGGITTTAIPDAGATVPFRIDVSATQIRITRTDTNETTGWITNSDWRGTTVFLSGMAGISPVYNMNLVSASWSAPAVTA